MMNSCNSCNFIGRLVDDPKMYSGEKRRAGFILAVDRDNHNGQNGGADYFDFVAWGDTADYVVNRFHKGDLLLIVNARAKVRKFVNGDGINVRKNEFVIDQVYCIGHAKSNDEE